MIKQNLFKYFFVLGFIIISGLISPAKVNACTCKAISFDDAVKQSTYIFRGQVLNIVSRQTGTNEVSFNVSQVYKGLKNSSLQVTTLSSSSACGFPFEKNKNYLVFAQGSDTNFDDIALSVNSCSLTSELALATDNLKKLEQLATTPTPLPTKTVIKNIDPTFIKPTSQTNVVNTNPQLNANTVIGFAVALLGTIFLILGIIFIVKVIKKFFT